MLVFYDAYSSYLKDLRAVARGIWTGAISYDQAWEAGDLAVRTGITRAWYEGLAEAGIQPSEMSDEEGHALRMVIVSELTYLHNFLTLCEDNSKANGGAWGTCDSRAQMWALRAKEARNRALLLAKTDPKLIWRLGRTEVHCGTCFKLAGKVKRASYWRKIGVQPQNPPNSYLECGGWGCDCSLSSTSDPLSKGTLGSLP